MEGSIDELYLSQLHERRRGDEQSSLSSFGGGKEENLGTVIAAVTDPTGGIREASDEFRPELGMPSDYLQQFRARRSEAEDPDSVEAHNNAVEELNLEALYKEHIKTDEEASEAIEELAQRVADGEDIHLVCFEKPPKWCHRHSLVTAIRERASELADD